MLRRRPQPRFSRLAAVVFTLAMAGVAALLVVPLVPSGAALREGESAPQTIQAAHGAQYESTELTEQARADAARAVPLSYLPPDPAVKQAQLVSFDRLVERVRIIRQRADLPATEQRLAELNAYFAAEKLQPASSLGPSLLLLDPAAFDAVALKSRNALRDIMDAELHTEDGAQAKIDEYLKKEPAAGTAAELAARTALTGLITLFVAPNSPVNDAATERARQEARDNVSPVIVTYTRGQVVVREGERLQPEDIEALHRTGVIDDGFNVADDAAGAAMSLGFAIFLGIFLYQFQPFERPAARRALLVGLAIAGVLVAVRFVLPEVLPDREGRYLAFAVPVAAAAMVTASFAGLPFAVVTAVAVGIFATFIGITEPGLAGASFSGTTHAHQLAVAYIAGGLAGALSVHRAERLSRYAVSAVAVAFATWSVLSIFWLLDETQTRESFGWLSLAAGINGLGAAVVTVGAHVVLSIPLGVTTRLQLLELAHGGHPLLRRLQEEAPGTYHHSMMVGALAERAANRIGADALAARVGAYYHDIGKLSQPGFYIENMLEGAPSPHDALAPAASAATIREHVTAGVELARKHRLPLLVRDFIPEHHGTRLVTFFYRRAVQAGGDVDPALFRYAGPRPQTKEAAIVMLGDSCEAVVRASGEPGRSRIDETVDGVFAERLAEGQLDECDITMRELQEVAASFKATLKAVYHPRIPYPDPVPAELAEIGQRDRLGRTSPPG
ncbi:MAG: HDIG domain-containing protein [Chloroflexi bacterium]|nr:HDIG domain-containing protein [Chloroflexota bacterium]